MKKKSNKRRQKTVSFLARECASFGVSKAASSSSLAEAGAQFSCKFARPTSHRAESTWLWPISNCTRLNCSARRRLSVRVSARTQSANLQVERRMTPTMKFVGRGAGAKSNLSLPSRVGAVARRLARIGSSANERPRPADYYITSAFDAPSRRSCSCGRQAGASYDARARHRGRRLWAQAR